MTPNLNLYPPEGYVFHDPKAGDIVGGNWPEVITKLRAYRIGANLPVGAPETEVYEQFCRLNPSHCHGGELVNGQVQVQVKRGDYPMAVMAWLSLAFTKVNRQKLGFVSKEEAARRAELCANCPKQQVWKTGCMGCHQNIHLLVDELLKGRKETAVAKGLQGCSVYNEDTRASVHLDQVEDERSAAPKFCWRC